MNQTNIQADPRKEVVNRMQEAGMPDLAIRTFLYYYEQLRQGQTGLITESDIEPVLDLPDLEELSTEYAAAGEAALSQTVLLKLNGGLGTGMGLQDAKSLLEVRDALTFLDIIATQAVYRDVPLVLMNSFATADSSRERLKQHAGLTQSIPLDFLQHKAPKIDQADFSPVTWPQNPTLEWCPPGHGDIYTALLTTGMLEKLHEAGYKYLFVSNSDNLGAVLDSTLLGYFSQTGLPFMMEVADRTFADRKGGHLAQNASGRLLLRESAQCPAEEIPLFQDIERHRFFNTNNLWIQLDALDAQLKKNDGIMGLPMIRNAKTVDPRDSVSTGVFQLETAMGAAIAVFERAGAIRVPRTRFAPVKTTNELLAVRSDACVLNQDHTLTLHPDRNGNPCVINLDRNYFKTVDQFETRFPEGPPSLLRCTTLQVDGDVLFEGGVSCVGDVHIVNNTGSQARISANHTLEGQITLD